MKRYFALFVIRLKRYQHYPHEAIILIVRRVISLSLLLLFWWIVSKNGELPMEVRDLFAYFLVAKGISDSTMGDNPIFGSQLRRKIHSGEINMYFLKPLSHISYLYMDTLGMHSLRLVFAAVYFIIGCLLFSSISIIGFLIFIPFFISAYGIAFAFNLFQGALAFVFTEIAGVKNALSHVMRIFSGALVPLSFFPSTLRAIADLSPFPSMVYGPITALQSSSFSGGIWVDLAVSFAWCCGLLGFSFYLWRRNMKKYEAVGA